MLQGNRKSRKRLSKYLKKPMQKKKYLKKQVKDLIQYASFIERETSPNDAVMESLEANWHKSRHTIEIQQTHDHQIYPIGV
jgi:predicted RNase H-like nuclease